MGTDRRAAGTNDALADVDKGMAEDDERIVQARAGSMDAIAELFDAYWLTAWRAAHAVTGRRDLADDAAQDAFVSAIRGLATFEPGRPFAPWIARIAVNRARDLLRAEHRRARLLENPLETRAEAPQPDEATGLPAALAALSVERREVVVLHHVLGLRLSEVAETVGAPEGTVASRLSRALAELRERLEEREHA